MALDVKLSIDNLLKNISQYQVDIWAEINEVPKMSREKFINDFDDYSLEGLSSIISAISISHDENEEDEERADKTSQFYRLAKERLVKEGCKEDEVEDKILNLIDTKDDIDSLLEMEIEKSLSPTEDELKEAEEANKKLNLKDEFDKDELAEGIQVEYEHGTGNKSDDAAQDTNVTNDDPVKTAKIAVAHLRELPDYYTRLDEMEEEGKEELEKSIPSNLRHAEFDEKPDWIGPRGGKYVLIENTEKIPSEKLSTLKTGTVIGDEESINEWSKNSVIKREMYHYSKNRENILNDGFTLGERSKGDGIYFAFDKELSSSMGAGSKPIISKINVSEDKYIDFVTPSKKASKNLKEWSKNNEFPSEPGTIKPFMDYYGYKVWNDGMQIGVMDPKVIGIINEDLSKVNKAKIYFNPELGEQAPKGVNILVGPKGGHYYDSLSLDVLPNERIEELKQDKSVFWHGTPTQDLRGGKTGLHVGTYEAAKDALNARIGIPVEGDWNGNREYGKTLLAGQKTLKERGESITGINCDVPEEDFYPDEKMIKYSPYMKIDSKPTIIPVKIKGEMSNTKFTPHRDEIANGLMMRHKNLGNAKRGYYYKNIAEDEGSISATVPSEEHLELIKSIPPMLDYKTKDFLGKIKFLINKNSVEDKGIKIKSLLFNMLRDYAIICAGGKIKEYDLDDYIYHIKDTLGNNTGNPDVKLNTNDEWLKWYKENNLDINASPEYKLWKQIEDIKTTQDKIDVLHNWFRLEHQNEVYIQYFPEANEEIKEYVVELLKHLLGSKEELKGEFK